MIENRMTRLAVVAMAGVAAATMLAGCGLGEAVNENANGHIKNVSYATGVEGKSNAEAQLPGWVPDQASSISESIRTTGSERILRFTLNDPASLTACRPAPASATKATLTATWWPSGQEAKTDKLCGADWYLLLQGTDVYAFRPETITQPSS